MNESLLQEWAFTILASATESGLSDMRRRVQRSSFASTSSHVYVLAKRDPNEVRLEGQCTGVIATDPRKLQPT
jgi:hypothetical protein